MRRVAVFAMLFVSSTLAWGQASGGRRTGVIVQGLWQRWEFTDTVAQDSLRITGVTQMSFPVILVGAPVPSWTFEVASAYAVGAVQLADGSERLLNGLTDARVRLHGPILRDRLLLTLGYNAPTGKAKLSESEVAALRVLGAPAFRLAVPVFGTGPSGFGGLVFAQRVAGWSLALGATYEYRGRYAPIEAIIAGQPSATNLDPAEAIHYSVGVDRLVGSHRVAFLWNMDRYATDKLSARAGPQAPPEVFSTYRLGPNYRVLGQVELAAPRFREFTITTQWRKRTPYTNDDGQLVTGSDGTVFDGQISTVLGSPRGFGLIAQIDLRHDSGLDVEDTFITAAMRARGGTIGLSIPLGVAFLEVFARGETGTIDLGGQATALRGVSYGVSLVPR